MTLSILPLRIQKRWSSHKVIQLYSSLSQIPCRAPTLLGPENYRYYIANQSAGVQVQAAVDDDRDHSYKPERINMMIIWNSEYAGETGIFSEWHFESPEQY